VPQTVLLRSGLPRFATDVFQLIAGMFHFPPDRADIAAQVLNRARNLLCQVPQVTAGDRCISAILLYARAIGCAVTTVEGLGRSGALHPLQQAFIEQDATQCGFCTPGQLLAAASLLARQPDPSEDDVRRGMSGNLCRCGTYPRIVAAVIDAGRRMREAEGA
jgi:aerobic-type carbon monoxide dehydrogenase small subunit (CoxS/CutS family)